MSRTMNRREAATVVAGLRLLAGDSVAVPNYPRPLVAGLVSDRDADYQLRYEAEEDYLRELAERLEALSMRGARLCRRCASGHAGTWRCVEDNAICIECDRKVSRHFTLEKAAPAARRSSRRRGPDA